MASEFDTTGVVTKISDNSCDVSTTIDNVQKTFSCSKFLVYVFGFQCEGNLTALLEVGADVEIRYRLSNKSVPLIEAVWCGEKPDHLSNESRKLRACYDQQGHVLEIRGDNVLVQNDDLSHTVLINKEVVYRDGCRMKNGAGLLSIDELVNFDAIPFEIEHPAGVLYQATCAWVGPNPRLCERFGLQGLTLLDDLWDNENPTELVHGIVAVIPNEVVAFAEPECARNNSKVMLMRSSFAPGCGSLKDVVNVGDKLCMRVCCRYLFNDTKQWFALQAWRDGSEIDFGGSLQEPEDHASLVAGGSGNSSVTNAQLVAEDLGISSEGFNHPNVSKKRTSRPRRKRDSKDTKNDRLELETFATTGDSAEVFAEKLETKFDKNSQILKADPPLSGVVSILSKSIASILYDGLKIVAERKNFYHDGKPCQEPEFLLLLMTEIQKVNFEAVKTNIKKWINEGFSHEATCFWVGRRPSVATLVADNAALKTTELVVKPKKENSRVPLQTSAQTAEVNFDKNSPVLLNDPPLSGSMTCLSENSACISYKGLKIFVSSQDFYKDGSPCTDLDTRYYYVNFEAVKTKTKEMIESGYSHAATCVWVGQKPSLTVVARTLLPIKFSLAEEKGVIFKGVVRKLCLPKVALIVTDETTVCLHVSAFGCKPKENVYYISGKDCISQFVSINDTVTFKIARVPSFYNVLSATDVRVYPEQIYKDLTSEKKWESGAVILEKDHSGLTVAGRIPSAVEVFCKDDTSERSVSPSNFFREESSIHAGETINAKTPNPPFYATPEEVSPPLRRLPGIVYNAVPFKCYLPALTRTWYIRCSGTLSVDCDLKTIRILPTNFTVDYTNKENPALVKCKGKCVCFDAMEKDGYTCVKKLWIGKDSPSIPMCLGPEIRLPVVPRFLPSLCRAVIVSIPLHDCAIGEIMGIIPVLITLKSLVTEEDMNLTSSTIDAFLDIGEHVSVETKVVETNLSSCPRYLIAENCWQIVKLQDSDDVDHVEGTVLQQRASWQDKWCDGLLFITGKLKRENDRDVVTFESTHEIFSKEQLKRDDSHLVAFDSRPSKTVTLTIPQNCFFVNKKLTEPPKNLDGEEVTFHVARDSSNLPIIPIAWIGETPPALDVLFQQLSVPKGVISQNWFYEGVVEDFPLPTRAVCRVGAVPVLIKIGGVYTDSGEFVKQTDISLVNGSRVLMRVVETFVGDVCCLESTETRQTKTISDAIVNLAGTVTSLPRPVGKIAATSEGLGDIDVVFELASVQIPEGMDLSKKHVFDWFDHLNDTIKVGTTVYFTAIKSPNKKQTSYRAVQVWLGSPASVIRKRGVCDGRNSSSVSNEDSDDDLFFDVCSYSVDANTNDTLRFDYF